MNNVQLKGMLTNDVELKERGSHKIATFLLAVAKPGRQRDDKGNWKKGDMVPVVTFGMQAELAARYLEKGRRVLVEGHLASEFWPPQKGPDSRLYTKVVAERIEYLDRPPSTEPAAEAPVRGGRTR